MAAKISWSGTPIDLNSYFNNAIDIHHIFPRAWCEKQNLPKEKWNSVVNKAPLAASTKVSSRSRRPAPVKGVAMTMAIRKLMPPVNPNSMERVAPSRPRYRQRQAEVQAAYRRQTSCFIFWQWFIALGREIKTIIWKRCSKLSAWRQLSFPQKNRLKKIFLLCLKSWHK